ncbi:hypothetical protein [Hymenobacter pini]|uniref:hypothetical protein n=1 Tax=Hymenobacter pini TaxID=2880879 RepID=UPI001CF5B1AA|nr:hypothetical protein [Hymenobacter pini]MCA8831534.1 hypothetical protein [Hymenobacter pini]
MKSTSLATFFLLALGVTALPGCGDDDKQTDPQPPAIQSSTVTYQLGMTGYAAAPNTIARLGVAPTLSDAQIGKGTILAGSMNWSETKGGKETKPFVLANKPVGTKYWVFVSTKQKPTSTQSITVTWPVSGTLTLSSSTNDTLAIQEMTVQ